MTTETFWMAGGLFELSYNISSSTTTPHEIESYAKTTGDGTPSSRADGGQGPQIHP